MYLEQGWLSWSAECGVQMIAFKRVSGYHRVATPYLKKKCKFNPILGTRKMLSFANFGRG